MNSDDHRLPRLKRLNRLYVDHPLYFVTACTENRKPILANKHVHDDFQTFCQSGQTHGAFVGRYVLMPDHLHLFVTFGDEYLLRLEISRLRRQQTDLRLASLSEWMKTLKNSLSKTLRRMNVPPPHWQKGFFDHVVRSDESYSEKWLYVLENPVRKHLVSHSQNWPYQGEIYPLQARGHI